MKQKLDYVLQLKNELPQDIAEKIDFFITIYVLPLMSVETYYDFIFYNFGEFQEDGSFKPHSEFTTDMIGLLMHSHCCFLQSRLKEYFKTQFDVEI